MTLIKTYGIALAAAALSLVGAAACSDSGTSDGTGTGPAAKLVCPSSGKNAFQTYGTAFETVNEAIFTQVNTTLGGSDAAKLGSSFGQIGMNGHDGIDAFKGKLAAFLVFVYGGPDHFTYTDGVDYDGVQDMATEHTGLNITSDEYNFFVTSVIVPVLQAAKVPDGDINACFAPPLMDASFMASIVGK